MASRLSFDEAGLQHGWDATSLSAFSKCPRYYQLTILEGWESLGGNVHFRFGGTYATALEHYFKYLADGMTEDEALCEIIHEALISTWDHELFTGENGVTTRIPGTGAAWNSLHNTKTRENLIRTIIWYLDHFAEDPTNTIILPDGTPAVEYTVSLPLDNGITLSGHLDRLVEYGGVFVMDQKTTGGTLSAHYFKQFSPDIQFTTYSYMGGVIFGSEIKGVIIDAAQIAVGFTRFARGFAHRSHAVLDEYLHETMSLIEQARTYTAQQFFPMNRTACSNYGGCTFREVCSRNPEHRPGLLAAGFEKREVLWDPLARR